MTRGCSGFLHIRSRKENMMRYLRNTLLVALGAAFLLFFPAGGPTSANAEEQHNCSNYQSQSWGGGCSGMCTSCCEGLCYCCEGVGCGVNC